ncbi:hypothetical protein QQ045_008346 [Rhodiola kirilowii]
MACLPHLGKMDGHDGQLSHLYSYNKRSRLTPMEPECILQQHTGPFLDGLQGQSSEWRNALLQQQLQARIIQYTHSGVQKYQSHMVDGLRNQEAGMTAFSPAQRAAKFVSKEEHTKTYKLDRPELCQPRSDLQIAEQDTSNSNPQHLQFAQRLPSNAIAGPVFSQAPWRGLGQLMGKRVDQLQKIESEGSSQVSSGSFADPPLSLKSGELSSGSTGAQFGVVSKATSFGTSQKAAVGMIRSVGGISCMTLSDNGAIQQQQPPKTRIHSLPKTLVLSSGAGSPVSEGITIIPSVEMEQTILERFAEIEMVTITNG